MLGAVVAQRGTEQAAIAIGGLAALVVSLLAVGGAFAAGAIAGAALARPYYPPRYYYGGPVVVAPPPVVVAPAPVYQPYPVCPLYGPMPYYCR